MEEYCVEVLVAGEPWLLIDLHDTSAEAACRRAKNSAFVIGLKGGFDYPLADISTGIYQA